MVEVEVAVAEVAEVAEVAVAEVAAVAVEAAVVAEVVEAVAVAVAVAVHRRTASYPRSRSLLAVVTAPVVRVLAQVGVDAHCATLGGDQGGPSFQLATTVVPAVAVTTWRKNALSVVTPCISG